jgi:hypothetical protein
MTLVAFAITASVNRMGGSLAASPSHTTVVMPEWLLWWERRVR